MTEATVVNLFFTFRVALVGGILFVYPRIARKGLVFGTYVGEAQAEGDEARHLLRSWNRATGMLMLFSLLVGWCISLAGWPVTGNLTGTAILLSLALLLYVWMYQKARALASTDGPPVRQASAPFAVDETRGEGFAKVALGLCVLAGLAVVCHATVQYGTLPDQIPTFAHLFGLDETLADKSIVQVLFVPSLNLVLSSGFALIALLVSRAKRSVRGGDGGRSPEAQDAFRVVMSQTLGGMALFICLILSTLSIQTMRVASSRAASLNGVLVWMCVAMILFALACLVRMMKGYGQGGALLESGSVEAPLTGGLADNSHWFLWGTLYFDREDSSILMESRFGIGYTFNFGNRTALLITALFLLPLVLLAFLVLTGAVS